MNVRKVLRPSKRTVCRECHAEISQKYFQPGQSYDDWRAYYESDEYKQKREACTKEREQRDKDNKEKLWILEGWTASGPGNEVICEKHLRLVTNKINTALGSTNAEEPEEEKTENFTEIE